MIDTADKRASAAACGLAFLAILPTPEGAIDAGDRLQVAALYRGIPVGDVTEEGGVGGGEWYHRVRWPVPSDPDQPTRKTPEKPERPKRRKVPEPEPEPVIARATSVVAVGVFPQVAYNVLRYHPGEGTPAGAVPSASVRYRPRVVGGAAAGVRMDAEVGVTRVSDAPAASGVFRAVAAYRVHLEADRQLEEALELLVLQELL